MDINYNELFDIETAETVEAQGNDGTESTPVEPQEGNEAQEQTQPTEGEKAQESEPEKQEQTTEERARQAEGRRRREWEERGAKAERERNSALLARLGIKNPNTDEVFTTLDELEAYEKGLRDTRLKEGRANDGDIREVVREEIARASEPEKSAETSPSSPQRDPRIDAELAEIKRLDPEMEDLKAILNSEYGPQFRRLVNAGESFLEAFKYVARDKLDKQRADKAAEAARIQAASKDHLSATGSRGQGALSVPADIMAQYRVFMPDASPEEIQKHYNADRKRYGPK